MTTKTLPNIAEHFKVETHNGTITIQNRETKEHRTFRIHTQKADASFCPGARIVSLLVGKDNESDYEGFGFVNEDGFIYLWKRFNTSTYDYFRRMLSNPTEFQDKYEYSYAGKCCKCNRKLTNPASITSGIGPECRKRSLVASNN